MICFFSVREELVERRIEEADGDRQPVHLAEDADEVPRWCGRSFARRSRGPHVVREDHLAHRTDALLVEEHVLGAAEADALGAERARSARRAGVGVGAHLHRAHLVGPGHELAELARERRVHGRDGAPKTWPAPPSR